MSPAPFSEEQEQRLQLARVLQSLVKHPGWHWWEQRLSERIDAARIAALAAPPASGSEMLRQWQITDEVISSMRYEIQSILDEWAEHLKVHRLEG